MSIRMRGPDGNIVYLGMAINCKEYRTEVGEDGIIEKIECAASTVKPECETCSLPNAVKPKHGKIDSKD